MSGKLRAFIALLVLCPAGLFAAAAAPPNWIASWATSQQTPEARNALPDATLADATLRQTVHLSLGGRSWRLRLSNAMARSRGSLVSAMMSPRMCA